MGVTPEDAKTYAYYESEGEVMRARDFDGLFPKTLEVYRNTGDWEPYADQKDWFYNSQKIGALEADGLCRQIYEQARKI